MWQTLLTPVDLYCERSGPGLWAEPANASTKLAFIAAGLLAATASWEGEGSRQ
ncbi:hypothetical protein LB526_28720 [Mesorhizobium sp. CA6]|uniref:hypothetical protein n=1 Tax=Mesorhizobium sp. CA6 TaxID=588500 RepID=UPI001CCA3145|nr:hypothetical protein [Mesorhizobium sp. CA6]MBZ9770745.1 hypothetical protein [Mesorhizobium sp. CA6]